MELYLGSTEAEGQWKALPTLALRCPSAILIQKSSHSRTEGLITFLHLL